MFAVAVLLAQWRRSLSHSRPRKTPTTRLRGNTEMHAAVRPKGSHSAGEGAGDGRAVAVEARRRRSVLGVTLVGTTLVSVHGGLLRVAFPVIRADLGAAIPAIELVSVAGLVVTTATVVVFGRFAISSAHGASTPWGSWSSRPAGR